MSDELDVLKLVAARLEAAGISEGRYMRDTAPEMDERYRAMLMSLSGEQRLKMGCSMFDSAKALMQAGILERNPHASTVELRQALFIQLYGHEFDSDTRAKILAAIEMAAHPVAR